MSIPVLTHIAQQAIALSNAGKLFVIDMVPLIRKALDDPDVSRCLQLLLVLCPVELKNHFHLHHQTFGIKHRNSTKRMLLCCNVLPQRVPEYIARIDSYTMPGSGGSVTILPFNYTHISQDPCSGYCYR